jgi:hypothetical protein
LAQLAFNDASLRAEDPLLVTLWQSVSPPLSLVRLGDEGPSEADVILETPFWVWFMEAKYQSDISTGTTTRPDRDQVLRNIDVGSYYAGTRDFYFSLLIQSPERSPLGVKAVQSYADLSKPREILGPHRPDGLKNLKAVSVITWRMLSEVMMEAGVNARRSDEKGYAERAIRWLEEKGLGAAGA